MEVDKIKIGDFVFIEHWGKRYYGQVKKIEESFDTYKIQCLCSEKPKDFLQSKKLILLDATPNQIKEILTKEKIEQKAVLDEL